MSGGPFRRVTRYRVDANGGYDPATALEAAPNALIPVRAYLRALQEAKQHENVLTASQPYLEKTGFKEVVGAVRACSLEKLGRRAEAEKLFAKSMETIPADYAMSLLPQLREAYGITEAVKKLDGWVASGTKNWRPFLIAGVAYGEVGSMDKSVVVLVKARDLASMNAFAAALANRHLGAAYYQLRKFQDAERAYKASLETRPGDVQVLNNLAYLYTNDLNEPKKALPYAARAAREMPNNARVLDTFGWTLARIGKFSDAELALVRAVRLEEPLAASRYHLGWVYERLGRLDDALKQYRQGFEMVRTNEKDPLHAPLKAALDRVQDKLNKRTGSAR